MLKNLETKVIAAAAGAGGGGAVSGFALWLLGVTVWDVPNDAEHATQAVAAVPTPVALLLAVVLAVIGAVLAGYAAPHTDRTDLTGPQSAIGALEASLGQLAGPFLPPKSVAAPTPDVLTKATAPAVVDLQLSPGDVTSRAVETPAETPPPAEPAPVEQVAPVLEVSSVATPPAAPATPAPPASPAAPAPTA